MTSKNDTTDVQQQIQGLRQRIDDLENSLRESEERFSTLANDSPVGIFLDDPQGNAVYINDKCAELVGVPAQKALNLDWVPFIHPDDRERVTTEWAKAFKNSDEFHQEYRWVHPDGKVVWTLGDIVPVIGDNDKATLFFGTLTDITALKQAHEQLHVNEEQLLMAQQLGHTGSWVYDIETATIWGSTEAHHIFGISHPDESFSIDSIEACLPERERVHQALVALINEEKEYNLEFTINPGDGSLPRDVISIARLKKDVQGNPVQVLGFIQDITERKQAEGKIKLQSIQRQKLLEMGRQLTSTLDIEKVFNYVSKEVRRLLGGQGVTIYMLENDDKILSPVLTYDPLFEQDVMATKIDVYNSLAGKAIKAKQGMIFNFADADPDGFHIPGTPAADDHLIIAPFIIDEKAIGSLNIYRSSATFDEDDLALVETFTMFASTAIKNARKHDEVMVQIVERKHAEELIKEKEERYRSVLQSANDAIISSDSMGIIIDWNKGAENIFGYTKAEIIGKNITEIMSHDYRIQHNEGVKRVNKGGEDWVAGKTLELVGLHKNGQEFPVELSSAEWESSSGIYFTGIIRDITERKQAEEELNKLSVAIKQSPVSIVITDPGGKIEYVNPKFTEVTGYSFDEAFGQNSSVLKSGEQDDSYYKDLWTTISSGKTWAGEFHNKKKNGELFWESANISPILDDSGNITQYIAVKEDITARKQAEGALLSSEQKFKKAFTTSPDSININRLEDGVYVTINDGFTNITGYSKSDVIGKSSLEINIWDRPEDREKLVQGLRKDGVVQNLEAQFRMKDGKVIPGLMSAATITLDGEPHILSITRDITDRKALEAHLRQSQKLEAVGTMVGGISHELNNILQSLFLYGGLVKDDLPQDKELRANFDHMLENGERARNIVKQILTFSRKSSVDIQPHELHELVRDALVLERASLPVNIELKQAIDTDSGLVLCDKTHIHQIILNLCNNAQHAMEESGGVLTVSLKQVSESLKDGDPEAEALALKVSDTGHGIDAEDLEKVFDPFFTTKQFGKGTGLGLSVIHGIVDIMGGQITVASERGTGTTFRLLFPVLDQPKTDNEEPKPVTPPDDLKQTILLVDDEDSIRKVTQHVLSSRGHLVDSASDGKQALELFKSNPEKYDLVVTDQSMPEMSGADLTKAIRRTKSNIPIFLSTGELGVKDKKEFKDIGITAFIQKPWTVSELLEKIRELDKKYHQKHLDN